MGFPNERFKIKRSFYKSMSDRTKIKPLNKKEEYELEDRDFLLIETLKELTAAIRSLRKYG